MSSYQCLQRQYCEKKWYYFNNETPCLIFMRENDENPPFMGVKIWNEKLQFWLESNVPKISNCAYAEQHNSQWEC